jgi:hypothetical protein
MSRTKKLKNSFLLKPLCGKQNDRSCRDIYDLTNVRMWGRECRDVWFSALYSVNDMLLGNHAKKSKDKIIDVPNFSFPPCPFLSALLGIHSTVLKK